MIDGARHAHRATARDMLAIRSGWSAASSRRATTPSSVGRMTQIFVAFGPIAVQESGTLRPTVLFTAKANASKALLASEIRAIDGTASVLRLDSHSFVDHPSTHELLR